MITSIAGSNCNNTMPKEAAAIKFSNDASFSENSPLYKADEFRMYCFKVLPCSKRYVHDWTICPFAHPGEKARRRDPRLYSYTGVACPEMKKSLDCPRGDSCTYAHNVFEYWMHPSRYRTQLCNDGFVCCRKVCFFAHALDEIRVSNVKVDPNGEYDIDPFKPKSKSNTGGGQTTKGKAATSVNSPGSASSIQANDSIVVSSSPSSSASSSFSSTPKVENKNSSRILSSGSDSSTGAAKSVSSDSTGSSFSSSTYKGEFKADGETCNTKSRKNRGKSGSSSSCSSNGTSKSEENQNLVAAAQQVLSTTNQQQSSSTKRVNASTTAWVNAATVAAAASTTAKERLNAEGVSSLNLLPRMDASPQAVSLDEQLQQLSARMEVERLNQMLTRLKLNNVTPQAMAAASAAQLSAAAGLYGSGIGFNPALSLAAAGSTLTPELSSNFDSLALNLSAQQKQAAANAAAAAAAAAISIFGRQREMQIQAELAEAERLQHLLGGLAAGASAASLVNATPTTGVDPQLQMLLMRHYLLSAAQQGLSSPSGATSPLPSEAAEPTTQNNNLNLPVDLGSLQTNLGQRTISSSLQKQASAPSSIASPVVSVASVSTSPSHALSSTRRSAPNGPGDFPGSTSSFSFSGSSSSAAQVTSNASLKLENPSTAANNEESMLKKHAIDNSSSSSGVMAPSGAGGISKGFGSLADFGAESFVSSLTATMGEDTYYAKPASEETPLHAHSLPSSSAFTSMLNTPRSNGSSISGGGQSVGSRGISTSIWSTNDGRNHFPYNSSINGNNNNMNLHIGSRSLSTSPFGGSDRLAQTGNLSHVLSNAPTSPILSPKAHNFFGSSLNDLGRNLEDSQMVPSSAKFIGGGSSLGGALDGAGAFMTLGNGNGNGMAFNYGSRSHGMSGFPNKSNGNSSDDSGNSSVMLGNTGINCNINNSSNDISLNGHKLNNNSRMSAFSDRAISPFPPSPMVGDDFCAFSPAPSSLMSSYSPSPVPSYGGFGGGYGGGFGSGFGSSFGLFEAMEEAAALRGVHTAASEMSCLSRMSSPPCSLLNGNGSMSTTSATSGFTLPFDSLNSNSRHDASHAFFFGDMSNDSGNSFMSSGKMVEQPSFFSDVFPSFKNTDSDSLSNSLFSSTVTEQQQQKQQQQKPIVQDDTQAKAFLDVGVEC